MNTKNSPIYEEKLSSQKTAYLFIALVLAFLALTLWRVNSRGTNGLAITFTVLFLVFIFYTINYKTLIVRVFPEKLKLQFGIFSWTIPFENISSCELDNNIPLLMKYGGAGIHFMMVRSRYRVSFNFLEYDRVVIRLKVKQGWVQNVSFSTQKPEEIITALQEK